MDTNQKIPVIISQRNESKLGNFGQSFHTRNNLITINRDKRENLSQCPVTLMNARSVRANVEQVQSAITDKFKIVAITETWINTENDNFFLREIRPPGYTAFTENRVSGRGGGVALICSKNLNPRRLTLQDYSSFEYLATVHTSKSLCFTVVVIY